MVSKIACSIILKGNPQSKSEETNKSLSNGSSNTKVSHRHISQVEDVPYTAFSLPISKSSTLSSENLRVMVIE